MIIGIMLGFLFWLITLAAIYLVIKFAIRDGIDNSKIINTKCSECQKTTDSNETDN